MLALIVFLHEGRHIFKGFPCLGRLDAFVKQCLLKRTYGLFKVFDDGFHAKLHFGHGCAQTLDRGLRHLQLTPKQHYDFLVIHYVTIQRTR